LYSLKNTITMQQTKLTIFKYNTNKVESKVKQ